MPDPAAVPPRPTLARVRPPPDFLSVPSLVRALIRNPIEAWPEQVYREPIVRRRVLAREIVYVMDPGMIHDVLVEEADQVVKAAPMLRALGPALGTGLLTADGEEWRRQRRASAPTFRHDRIVSFLPAMLKAATAARDRLVAHTGRTVDIGHEMMRTTFEIIVETMLSGRAGIDVGGIERAMTDYLEATSWTFTLALMRAPPWLPYPGRRRAARGRDHMRGEVARVVAERRREGLRSADLVSLLLDATDPDTGQGMSDREMTDNLLTFIAAGHETTAVALTWAFYLLDLHPEITDRVLAEIADVTGGREVEPDHVQALAYTRQVVQEAMRLYPPAALLLRDARAPLRVGEHDLEPGVAIMIPLYAVHRHASLWDDPDRFDPDRFAPDAIKARHRLAYLPFGAGPRTCIGASFALLEAVAIMAVILPAVRLARPSGAPQPTLRLRVTLRPGNGMPMTVSRRSPA